MATFFPETVSVTVLLEGRQTTQVGFSTPLFLAVHDLFSERQKLVSSTKELLDLGFPSGSPAVKYSEGLFAGRQAPDLMRIGRIVPDTYTIQIATGWVTDDVISVNASIDGVKSTFSHTVTTETTQQEVGDALVALLVADAGIAVATASDANGLVTVVLEAGVKALFGAAGFTTIYTTTAEIIPDVMAAVEAETTDFAMLSTELHDKTNQQAIAAYAESNDLLALYSTQDANVLNAANTDNIFHNLDVLEYEYTCGFYNERADIDFGEGALAGTFAGQDPSFIFTTNLQTLTGITPDILTDAERSAVVSKNGNYYITEQGVGTFHEGFTPSADFIDRARFALWIKLRSQESMFNTLKRSADRSSGTAYSDAGIDIVRASLFTDVINVGIANGAILSTTSVDSTGKVIDFKPIVQTSTRAAQTNAAISQRLWEGFTVEVVYNSAIHHIDSTIYVVNNRTAV